MSKELHHLFRAITQDQLEQVKVAIKNHPSLVHATDDKGKTALIIAAEHGNAGIIDTLIKHDAHENYQLPEKLYTPLMVAAQHGRLEAVKYLVKHGADLHKTDAQGHDALWHAQQNDHKDVIDFLQSMQNK